MVRTVSDAWRRPWRFSPLRWRFRPRRPRSNFHGPEMGHQRRRRHRSTLLAEPGTGRVFVSRGTHVMIVDGLTGKVLGDISLTHRAHVRHRARAFGGHGHGFTTKRWRLDVDDVRPERLST